MTPTSEDCAIDAFCEAATNGVDHRIMWAAVTASLGPQSRRINSVLLDENIHAAIHAGEWLTKTVEAHSND